MLSVIISSKIRNYFVENRLIINKKSKKHNIGHFNRILLVFRNLPKLKHSTRVYISKLEIIKSEKSKLQVILQESYKKE